MLHRQPLIILGDYLKPLEIKHDIIYFRQHEACGRAIAFADKAM